jgi:hypothetical protein
MNTTLEDELRTAFTASAATLPPGATGRLQAVDYHPRRRRRAAPMAFGAGAVGAATAGTVLAVVLGGTAPAYAGWSAAPTASAPSTSSPSPQASQSCLTAHPFDQPGSGSWTPVVTDVRGPFTVTLLQNGSAYAACFTSSSFTEVTQVSAADGSASNGQAANGSVQALGSGAGDSIVTVGGTSSADLQNVVQTHLSTTADGPYTLVDGRVASGVTAVTLVRDDGQDVVATVEDGWLIAWWPGSATATSSEVTTSSGTSTEALQSADKGGPGPSTPPQPGACAAASGAANASKSSDGQPTNVAVHCASSGSGDSASVSANTGSSGAGLKSGG